MTTATCTFLCWLESQDPSRDEGWLVDAPLMHDAAEAFAKHAFHNMDMWESGGQFRVFVRGDWPDAPMARFTISVEAVPSFRARKMEDMP